MAPTLSEAEMRRQLQDLIKAASLVENRAYTLNPRAVLTGKTPEKTDPAVTSETLLWKEGMKEWQEAGKLPDIVKLLNEK